MVFLVHSFTNIFHCTYEYGMEVVLFMCSVYIKKIKEKHYNALLRLWFLFVIVNIQEYNVSIETNF